MYLTKFVVGINIGIHENRTTNFSLNSGGYIVCSIPALHHL